jgi:hypothetical protein
MISAGLGVSGAARMTAGCSGECGIAVTRSDTHLYCYAEWKHPSIQVASSGQVSCKNAFGTSSRSSLLTAESFTCPSLAFLAGVISVSVDSIRYFCVICFLSALWFKGSALECYCLPAVIPAKNMYLQTFLLHSVRRRLTAMTETECRNSYLYLVGFDRRRCHFVDSRTAADLSTHSRV